MIEYVKSSGHFEELKTKNKDFLMVLFYTDASDKSKTALKVMEEFSEENKDVYVCAVNAAKVKDIHTIYGISTVPTVLAIKNGKPSKIVYGPQSKEYYQRLLYDVPAAVSGSDGESRKSHNVVVYTSSSCPWCSTVKSYLMKNRIYFREVDISRDQGAAQELVRRSGQMGVPQTDIDGNIVVGFDQAKLDSFLGIKNN
ncbi:MAG: glutaredoxin [Candidatus Omnitrophica bacterium 4484_171]|nr:MAG: glutaredoxin [Candidatus Omnitrophica bacterium 4484_171]